MKPIFHIRQSGPFIDAKLAIRVTNLQPVEVVTVKAEMRDNVGQLWQSFAEFTTDSAGEIDLAIAKPLSGTYEEPDQMGLFWSMSPVEGMERGERTPLQPLTTTLFLMRGEEVVARTSITRAVISSNVQTQAVGEQGLVGSFFFHPESGPLPTILVLGGSEGGLSVNNAALLASYGFNTLALAYFAREDLPDELIDIPIEYIENAIDWLSNHPHVNHSKLGIFGISKGGELALVVSSLSSKIKAIVAYVASGVVYPGLSSGRKGSSWQYQGHSLPFAAGEIPQDVQQEVEKARQIGEPISWRKTYQFWAKGEEQAEIAVENSKGPILLISGGDDQLWPADLLSEQVINRLRRHGYPYDYRHINFPKAGHSFGVPGLPTSQATRTPYGNGNLLLGGTPKDQATAQFDAWKSVVAFLKKSLYEGE